MQRIVARNLGLASQPRTATATAELGKVLPMTMESQEQTNWCWAAVGTSVGLFFKTGQWTQCATAGGCLENQPDCCGDPTPCNVYGYLNKALDYTKSLGSYGKGTASASEIRTQIDLGHPVCALVNWEAGGAHFMAITGYSYPQSDPSQMTITIEDSIYGPSVHELADFPKDYQSGGTWTYVYLTAPKS